jgi:hypothetical protein
MLFCQALQQAGLYLNSKKSNFAKRKVSAIKKIISHSYVAHT